MNYGGKINTMTHKMKQKPVSTKRFDAPKWFKIGAAALLLGLPLNPSYAQTKVPMKTTKKAPIIAPKRYNDTIPASLWTIVDLKPKDNAKFGIPRMFPGITAEMIAKKFKSWKEIYHKFIGASPFIVAKEDEITIRTDKGEFKIYAKDFYPVAVSIEKNKISLTGIFLKEYKDKEYINYRISYVVQAIAINGKAPKYVVHNLETGITLTLEYRNNENVFESPLAKEYEPLLKNILKYLKKLPPNKIQVSAKDYKEAPLGKIFKAVVVKKPEISLLGFYPLEGNKVLIMEQKDNKLKSIEIASYSQLAGLDIKKDGELRYIYSNGKGRLIARVVPAEETRIYFKSEY